MEGYNIYIAWRMLWIIIIAIFFSSIVAQSDHYKDIFEAKISDMPFSDPNNPSEKYDSYKIIQNSIGKTWIEMKIQKDMELKFAWKKNGDKDTDLLFYLKKPSDETFNQVTSCTGFECNSDDWIKSEETYQVKEGDILRWGLWVRCSDLKATAWVAVNNPDGLVKPLLNQSSAKLENDVNVTPISSLRPPKLSLKGPNFGYVNKEYLFSAGEIENDKNILYQFECDNKLYNTQSDHRINFTWESPGNKILRVRALNTKGLEGNWSNELKIDVYNQTIVSSSDELLDVIETCPSYTEVHLNENLDYIMNNEIEIINKNHIIIAAQRLHGKLIGRHLLDRLISLNNSNNITIKNLTLKNSKCGIKLYNSNDNYIYSNIIEFGGCWCGIKHLSGKRNRFEKNQINYTDTIDCLIEIPRNPKPTAIKIEKGSEINISNTTINGQSSITQDIYVCYYIENDQNNQNINVTIPSGADNLPVIYGQCQALWTIQNGFLVYPDYYENYCQIPDRDNRIRVWLI